MSRMSELSQVLDEMIACGEGMIKAANALKDIFSSTEEAPAKAETKSTKKAAKAPEPAKTEEAPEPTGFSQRQNGSSQKNSPQKETNIKAAVLPGAAALFVKE